MKPLLDAKISYDEYIEEEDKMPLKRRLIIEGIKRLTNKEIDDMFSVVFTDPLESEYKDSPWVRDLWRHRHVGVYVRMKRVF